MKLISIIVPVYNVETYLQECLESILNQSYRDIEIIAVDDGSTDSSLMILNQLAEKDSRLRVYSKKNEGVSSTRNFALTKARGDYLLFVDSDDILAHGALDTAATIAAKHDSDLVIFGFKKLYTDTKLETITSSNNERRITVLEFLRLAFDETYKTRCSNGAYTFARLYKKDILQDLYFDTSRKVYEDEDFTSRLVLKLTESHKIFLLDEPFYWYRQRKSSLIHSNRAKRLFAFYSCRRVIARRFIKRTEYFRILEKARLTALIKLVQASLSIGQFSGFSLFQKILWNRKDIPFLSKLPYLLGKCVAKTYSVRRLEKSRKKNSKLSYWK